MQSTGQPKMLLWASNKLGVGWLSICLSTWVFISPVFVEIYPHNSIQLSCIVFNRKDSIHISNKLKRTFFHFSNMQFSAKDQENDYRIHVPSWAQSFKGAWWYRKCHRSNLNGMNLNGPHATFANGVNWYTFREYYYSLKRTVVKVKTKA